MIPAMTVNFHVRPDTPTSAVSLSTGEGYVDVTLGAWPGEVTLLGQAEDVERLLVAALEATRALGRVAAA